MPKPRKLKVDSVRMFRGTSRAAKVNRGVIRFGSTWRPMIRLSLAPIARAASTKACSRRESTTPLVTRQNSIQRAIANTMMILVKLGPRMNNTIRASNNKGTDMKMSTALIITSSRMPR